MDIIKYECWKCGEELIDYDPQMCCSGRECGCLGLPTNPPFCSEECYNNRFEDINKEKKIIE